MLANGASRDDASPSGSSSLPDRFAMKRWFFRISDDEIAAAAADLIDRHGADGARDEALRLADVARRIGSERNRAIFLHAAQRIAVGLGVDVTAAPAPMSRRAKIFALVAEFGAPRTPLS